MYRLLMMSVLLTVTAWAGTPGDGTHAKTRVTPEQSKAIAETLVQQLKTYHTGKRLSEGTYVGSEFCISCHQDQAGWRDTKHAQALRRPMAQYSLMDGKGVVADYDDNDVDDFQQGLNFNDISSVFDPYKPNAPILSYNEGNYYITIGENMMPVVATQGGTGTWKQRFLVRVPAADGSDGYTGENYVSPIQYNERADEYVLYRPEFWYDAANQPRFGSSSTVAHIATNNGATFSKECIGCHTTGIRDLGQDGNTGEWFYSAFPAALHNPDDPSYFDYDHDGINDLVNIGCESCHGPGSKHILGSGDPTQIVNPDKLDTAKANEVCGQCHSRVNSVPEGHYGFPYDEAAHKAYTPGSDSPLADFFTDASMRWPDGITSKANHQQYFDFLESPKPGFRFHPVKCVECHNSHGESSNDHQIREFIVESEELTIPIETDNNTLCLACHATHGDFSDITKEMVADYDANHATIAEVVSAHTKHPYGPDRRMGLSRCITCHNPTVAKSASEYDIHSHTFQVLEPERTLHHLEEGGMPNSCGVSCHATKVDSFRLGLDPDLGVWGDQHDEDLARRLMRYLGPEGRWWEHVYDPDGEDEGKGGGKK